ncbi:MAG: hypothetical protein HDS41_05435 [Bacteroides sp.]|nr:hypothetical protein [Bacteroides sp.]
MGLIIERRKRKKRYYGNEDLMELEELLSDIPDIKDFHIFRNEKKDCCEYRFMLDEVVYRILMPIPGNMSMYNSKNRSDEFSGVNFYEYGFLIYPTVGYYTIHQLVEMIRLIRLRLAKYTSKKYYQRVENFYKENAPKIRIRFCGKEISQIDVPGRLVPLYLTAYQIDVDKYETQGIVLDWLFYKLELKDSDTTIVCE